MSAGRSTLVPGGWTPRIITFWATLHLKIPHLPSWSTWCPFLSGWWHSASPRCFTYWPPRRRSWSQELRSFSRFWFEIETTLSHLLSTRSQLDLKLNDINQYMVSSATLENYCVFSQNFSSYRIVIRPCMYYTVIIPWLCNGGIWGRGSQASNRCKTPRFHQLLSRLGMIFHQLLGMMVQSGGNANMGRRSGAIPAWAFQLGMETVVPTRWYLLQMRVVVTAAGN